MRRYEMDRDYEPYTGQYLGIIGVPDDGGDWVRAEDAERIQYQRDMLREAVRALMDFGNKEGMDKRARWAMNKARAALKATEE